MITIKIGDNEKQFNKQLLISKSKYFDTLFNNCSDIPNVIDLSRFHPQCLDVLEEYINNPKYESIQLDEERPLFVFEYQKANIPYWKVPEMLEASTQYNEYPGIIPMRYRYDKYRNSEFSKYEKIMCIKGGLYEFADYLGIKLIQQICTLYYLSSLERSTLPEYCTHYMSLYIPWVDDCVFCEKLYEHQIKYPENEYDLLGFSGHKCLAAYITDLTNNFVNDYLNQSKTETIIIDHFNVTENTMYPNVKNIISFEPKNAVIVPLQAKNIISNSGFTFIHGNYNLDLVYCTNANSNIITTSNSNRKVDNIILNDDGKMMPYSNYIYTLSYLDSNTLNIISRRSLISYENHYASLGEHKEINMYIDWNPTTYTLDSISKILAYIKKCRTSKYYKNVETNLNESDEIKYNNILQNSEIWNAK
jgi:hypothetical protein